MKHRKAITPALVVAAAVGFGGANAQTFNERTSDGMILKRELGDTNYCHMKFPAMEENTLTSPRPALKPPGTGDIIDFYGPCDHDPRGEDEIAKQRNENQRLLRDTDG